MCVCVCVSSTALKLSPSQKPILCSSVAPGPVVTGSSALCPYSCLSDSDGMFGRHNSQVWNLGHSWSGALPQSGSHVLQRCPGSHCGVWYHKWGESGAGSRRLSLFLSVMRRLWGVSIKPKKESILGCWQISAVLCRQCIPIRDRKCPWVNSLEISF